MYQKNTKIVCTLGPSSDSVKEIVNLINAGMNVARLNFSHGSYENHAKLIENIHKAEEITGKRIGILQDLQGPKIRIGELPKDGIKLNDDDKFAFTTEKIKGKKRFFGETIIPVKYKKLTKDIKKNSIILINDGLLETQVLKINKTKIHCKVINGGIVKTGQGLNFPTDSISQKTITDKDLKDLKFGLKHNVDFVALSFVKSKKDINDLRKIIEKNKKNIPIIAKIERHEAVKNMREIIQASDGVMVARGDLGADMAPEKIPVVQKSIIAMANKYAKPVITATQVLFSMVKNPRPTRAEVSDAANAVYDHTDAIMLSNETATGKYPIKACQILNNVSVVVEEELQKHEELLENLSTQRKLSTLDATCQNAADIATEINADALIVYTEKGYTAREIAKTRIYTPIITITESEEVARKLILVWGLNEILVNKITEKTDKIKKITEFLKEKKLVKKSQQIVIVANASKKDRLITTVKI